MKPPKKPALPCHRVRSPAYPCGVPARWTVACSIRESYHSTTPRIWMGSWIIMRLLHEVWRLSTCAATISNLAGHSRQHGVWVARGGLGRRSGRDPGSMGLFLGSFLWMLIHTSEIGFRIRHIPEFSAHGPSAVFGAAIQPRMYLADSVPASSYRSVPTVAVYHHPAISF